MINHRSHMITVDALEKWRTAERVTFASSTKENKRLLSDLSGMLYVEHNGEIVWSGIEMFRAVSQYNSII